MSHATAANPVESGESSFAPGDYFLGIAQRVIASGVNTRISLPTGGDVFIYPERREYDARIDDPREFFQAPAGQFTTAPLTGGDEAKRPRHIDDLLWQAAFHASQGRLMEGASMFDIVSFKRWPNLPQLPHTANTARICALLTRHPTTIMLAHRLLGIKKDEVYRVYSAAYSAGIAVIVNRNPEAVANEAPQAELADERRGLLRSLFAKISGL
ncbi:MAG TPA: hypothetical protein VKC56_10420 [Gallionellaceae bacterium]|nr:hypothetical protein [Gallionellaceae bacterium]